MPRSRGCWATSSGVFVPRSLPSPAGRSSIRLRSWKSSWPSKRGWAGSAGQSLLVTPRFGSFVLLGELVLDAACDRYDEPLAGAGCGSCRRCVEACPTGAVCDDRAIDARRCISCHTIERTPAAEIALDGWIFGCDACQSRCPYNLRAPLHLHPAFDPLFDPLSFPPERWLAMEEAEFRTSFGRTPLMRSGLRRLQANAAQNLHRKGRE